ncbi:MAG: hypothetical protein NTW56_16900 [Alphaproteobacteria bacterium]|nr:hypothetical protein [Alphaproteobacteria bacterium]
MKRSALVLLALAGCAELTERPAPLPAGLAAQGDPVRGMALAAQQAFGDGGRALTGRPADMALAMARLEHLTVQVAQDPRFAAAPTSLRFQLQTGRREARNALGMADDVAPERAIAALMAARRALQANDAPAADRALRVVTRDGPLPPVERLSDMGGLPMSAIAMSQLREQIALLDAESGWRGSMLADAPRQGISVSGLGGNTDR